MSYTKYYYQILGVTPSAEDVVIRAAYKALVQRYHPDKYQGDPAEATRIVQELVEAYSILSDPEKRKTYDIWLRRKERQNENKPEEKYAAEDKSEVHEAGTSKDASNAPDAGAIEAYIGERNKDYYLAIFKNFDSKGVGLHRSWNWAAFLGGPAWLLYRKMYGFFFLFSTTLVASFVLVNTGRAAVGNLIHLFPLYVFAHYANAFYYRQAKRRVLSARMAKGDIGSQLGRLRREGGVHSWVIWASGSLGALFIVTVLIDSANSPIASKPSHLAVPSPDATADAPPATPKSFAIAKPAVVPVAAAPPSLDDAHAAYARADHGAAAQTYRLLAEQGVAEAQSNLGAMYYLGQGVPQDYVQAVKWYRLAAEQGDAAAQNNLGTMYEYGRGVPQDYVQAHKWYSLAASQALTKAESHERVVKNRDQAAARMTPAQLAEAQRLAREWKPKSGGSGQ